jgi:hypothetical protein
MHDNLFQLLYRGVLMILKKKFNIKLMLDLVK